jgi:hypothetical protein
MFRKGLRRAIDRALALKPRGGVKRDKLRVNWLSGQLQVEWAAREIHPWDRDLPPDRQAKMFCDQTITDVDRAVGKLFQALPEIDAITIRVVEPNNARRVLIAGTVLRKDLSVARSPSSSRMRLKLLGIQYQTDGERLEALPESLICNIYPESLSDA